MPRTDFENIRSESIDGLKLRFKKFSKETTELLKDFLEEIEDLQKLDSQIQPKIKAKKKKQPKKKKR